MTEWRPIPGFNGYDVSRDGQVRSWRWRGDINRRRPTPLLLSIAANLAGRPQVTLSVDNVRSTVNVHRLVAAAFIGPCPEGLIVCHNNGDLIDNRAENLRYDTYKENSADRARHGTLLLGEAVPVSKLTAADVRQIRELHRAGLTQVAISRRFGVGPTGINEIIRGRSWAWLKDDESAA